MPDQTRPKQTSFPTGNSAITWWSWRPGIKPRNAFIIGAPLTLLACFFICVGLYALLFGIIDSYSPPLQIPAVVTGYTTGAIDGQPRLTIRLDRSGNPTIISPVIFPATHQAIHTGDHILLDYSPHLHFLYALEHAGQRYNLPGSSALGNPFASFALIIVGLALLPYPLYLLLWAWRDLHTQSGRSILARVAGLHTTQQTRLARPGITRPISRTSYSVALQELEPSTAEEIQRFRIKESIYRTLHVGDVVRIVYSPHLHYVYSLKQADIEHPAGS